MIRLEKLIRSAKLRLAFTAALGIMTSLVAHNVSADSEKVKSEALDFTVETVAQGLSIRAWRPCPTAEC